MPSFEHLASIDNIVSLKVKQGSRSNCTLSVGLTVSPSGVRRTIRAGDGK